MNILIRAEVLLVNWNTSLLHLVRFVAILLLFVNFILILSFYMLDNIIFDFKVLLTDTSHIMWFINLRLYGLQLKKGALITRLDIVFCVIKIIYII